MMDRVFEKNLAEEKAKNRTGGPFYLIFVFLTSLALIWNAAKFFNKKTSNAHLDTENFLEYLRKVRQRQQQAHTKLKIEVMTTPVTQVIIFKTMHSRKKKLRPVFFREN